MSEREISGNIDLNRSHQYILSIRLSTDGFSFSICNPLSDSSIYYLQKETDPSLSFAANLKQAFREIEFLCYPFKKVNIMIINKRFTLVPFELFDDEQNEAIFYYNHSEKENEEVLYNILKKSNIAVLFGIDRSIFLLIKGYYPDARFYCQTATLIEYFAVKSRPGDSRKMYVHLNPDSIDVFCYEKGHILLINSFNCKVTEDRVYYLLYTWKQLQLDQEKDELYLTGNLRDRYNLLKELQRFILQVYIMKSTEEINNFPNKIADKVPFDMQIFSLNK